jgi:hypothetical protein
MPADLGWMVGEDCDLQTGRNLSSESRVELLPASHFRRDVSPPLRPAISTVLGCTRSATAPASLAPAPA